MKGSTFSIKNSEMLEIQINGRRGLRKKGDKAFQDYRETNRQRTGRGLVR